MKNQEYMLSDAEKQREEAVFHCSYLFHHTDNPELKKAVVDTVIAIGSRNPASAINDLNIKFLTALDTR